MKKSAEMIPSVWDRRKLAQVTEPCRGAGSTPASLRFPRRWGRRRRCRGLPARQNPPVTPRRILACHAQHQGFDVPVRGWTTVLRTGPLRPAAPQQVAVPAQDRVRGNEQTQSSAARFGYRTEQQRDDRAVSPVRSRTLSCRGELTLRDKNGQGDPRGPVESARHRRLRLTDLPVGVDVAQGRHMTERRLRGHLRHDVAVVERGGAPLAVHHGWVMDRPSAAAVWGDGPDGRRGRCRAARSRRTSGHGADAPEPPP